MTWHRDRTRGSEIPSDAAAAYDGLISNPTARFACGKWLTAAARKFPLPHVGSTIEAGRTRDASTRQTSWLNRQAFGNLQTQFLLCWCSAPCAVLDFIGMGVPVDYLDRYVKECDNNHMMGSVKARPEVFVATTSVVVMVLITTIGCSRDTDILPLYPVSGHITVEGEPLRPPQGGKIHFVPVESRAAGHEYYSSSEIQADGRYSLQTYEKSGAPLGNYKVVVEATSNPLPINPRETYQWKPKWIINEMYTNHQSTDLRVEVVEIPENGAYDVDLKR